MGKGLGADEENIIVMKVEIGVGWVMIATGIGVGWVLMVVGVGWAMMIIVIVFVINDPYTE